MPTEWDEDTNRKSMYPAPKTLHNGAQHVGQKRSSERAEEDFWSTEKDQCEATPKHRDVAMEMEMEPLDGQYGEVSSTSQVQSDDARREAKGRSVARPKNQEGGKEGDCVLPDRTLKVWSPDLFSVDSASAYHTAKIVKRAKQQGTSRCPEELSTEVEMQVETKEVRKRRERQALMFALSKDSEVEEEGETED